MEWAKERNDNWGNEVLGRVENCHDLVAVEAIHHGSCLAKFKLNRMLSEKKAGRPDEMMKGF